MPVSVKFAAEVVPLSTAFANCKSSSTVVIEILLLSAANAAVGSSVKHNARIRSRLAMRFLMVCPPLYGGQVLFMPA